MMATLFSSAYASESEEEEKRGEKHANHKRATGRRRKAEKRWKGQRNAIIQKFPTNAINIYIFNGENDEREKGWRMEMVVNE